MKWLLRLFRPNVDSVLKNFSKTINKLERTTSWHSEEADRQSGLIRQAEAARDASQKEALRADAVATKLKGIIGL